MAAYGASSAFVSGRFNIWVPNRPQNAYLSFDTLQEAQADVQAKAGVIINPSAQVDPSVQAWAGWSQFQTALPQGTVVLTPTAAPGTPVVAPQAQNNPVAAPVAGKYNVWVPANHLQQVTRPRRRPPCRLART